MSGFNNISEERKNEIIRWIFIGWCLAQKPKEYNKIIMEMIYNSKFCCKRMVCEGL